MISCCSNINHTSTPQMGEKICCAKGISSPSRGGATKWRWGFNPLRQNQLSEFLLFNNPPRPSATPPRGWENLLCYRNFLPFQRRCHEVAVGFYTQNRTILRRLHSSEFCKGSLRLLRWARNDPPVYQNPGRCIKRNPINYTVIARSPALRGDEAIPSILYILYIVYTGK